MKAIIVTTEDKRKLAINLDHIVYVEDWGDKTAINTHDQRAFVLEPFDSLLMRMGVTPPVAANRDENHLWGPWRITHDHASLVSLDRNGTVVDTFKVNSSLEERMSFQMTLNHGQETAFSFAAVDAKTILDEGKSFPGSYYHPEKP